jgi:CRISPR-associated endonuclease/helicase Cas3
LSEKSFFKYWGKAEQVAGDMPPAYHLLPYHCLDVAAVGSIILHNNKSLLGRLSGLAGLERDDFVLWAIFFLALHDMGKFADSFQSLNPFVQAKLQKRVSKRMYGGLRHDSLGFALWNQVLRQEFQSLRIVQVVQRSKRRQAKESPVDVWMAVVTGHHGVPAKLCSTRTFSDDFEDPRDTDAARTFVRELGSLLLHKRQFPKSELSKIRIVSWWIAGFTVLCDWLGSNANYFPHQSAIFSLDNYWQTTLKQAERAVLETGLMPVKISARITLEQLIPPSKQEDIVSTPLQQQARDFTITDSPHLFILEDVTGAGKTEAAVLLAHRLMTAGLGRGIYFALPTMATANSMYARMGRAYRYLFSPDSNPSLILAHGARELSREFRQSILPVTAKNNADYGDGTMPAGAHCNGWLADNRKKSLLADIGVGTIDQALLAVLPSRHQCLRLLGLLTKILIVDEVHACDSYMHELLCTLLKAHRAAGGSAILLSATLPQEQRQALVDSYMAGQSLQLPVLEKTDYSSYPLFTSISDHDTRELVVDTRVSAKRVVHVKLMHEQKDIETLLDQTVAAAKCACWIRNTVADARETFVALQRSHPDWNIELFHARFTLGDRLDIENRVVQRFGKNSGNKERKGRILIATQVVEQSLDLDFDEMITDLAPIDLIVQRSGRLRRHSRDNFGNRKMGKDERGEITLHILAPPVVENPGEDWFAGFFKRTGKVYPHHGQLFLTAELMQSKGKFRMPEDARELIESVYGPEAQDAIPASLLENSFDAEGEAMAAAGLARLNTLDIPGGYSNTDETVNRWWDEALTPTRLGEETTTVYLACYERDALFPFRKEKHNSWQYSSVSMRTHGIASETDATAIPENLLAECRDQLPAKGKWGVLVPIEKRENNLWQGVAKNKSGKEVTVYYRKDFGLMLDNEYQQLQGKD